ncbi:MAG: hypothetical protein IT439_04525 [Phycisphaerales bacterium]|nr:hypothetical protein [Phycisphaerales bacterium]
MIGITQFDPCKGSSRGAPAPGRRVQAALGASLALALGLSGCAGAPHKKDRTPWDRALDTSGGHEARVAAIAEAWGTGPKGPAESQRLSDIFWSKQSPRDVRLGVLDVLSADPDGHDELRDLLRGAIPFETDPPVMQRACDLAAQHQWQALTTPLVRSLARVVMDVADEARPEFKAIEALNPGTNLVAVALACAGEASRATGETPQAQRIARRPMMDAWTLASRHDVMGDARRAWLRDPANADFLGGAAKRVLDDFAILAATGDELLWIEQLADPALVGAAWWPAAAEAARAAGVHDRSDALELRHLEALRVTHAIAPDRLARSKSELLSELESRLHGRQVRVRSGDRIHTDGPNRERPRDWSDRLGRFDLLAALAIDDLLASPRVRAALPEYIRLDRQDETCEYGGVLVLGASGAGELVLYPPRPEERVGDAQFVASTDMLRQWPHALAHFHFHAQPGTTTSKAGPSRGDLGQAARSGRSSLVMTTITEAVVNVDLYQPDGAVIDLGDVRLGGP